MKELALHIMDIMQNSIAAKSKQISVIVELSEDERFLCISVEDDGVGMDGETLKNAADPFHTSRTTRKVGLGIPMFKEAALMTGGDFHIESKKGKGTSLTARFVNRSVDRQPLGDLGNVMFLNMLSNGEIRFKLVVSSAGGRFVFDSNELLRKTEAVGGSLMDAAFEAEPLINDNVKKIFGGALPEMGGDLYGA